MNQIEPLQGVVTVTISMQCHKTGDGRTQRYSVGLCDLDKAQNYPNVLAT